MTQPPHGGPTGSPAAPPPRDESTARGTSPTGPQHAAPTGPAAHAAPRPARNRRGLVIASLVLVAAVLLCGGGGVAAFLTLRDAEHGEGPPEPTTAVDSFMAAVYRDRDPAGAADLVCAAARDEKKIAAKVAEVEEYAAAYRNPRFRWTSPTVDNQNGDRATVTTRLTMTTSDEKVADQDLRFTVVRKQGWWVCEVG
ncbi:hypothetical protein AWW66_15390 [Micromonospora rosaria]|uniref:Ig-like domain-containing protein n=1 Tax=Micromonospora rosaria TaxID=47874 RepID=A0A136PRQ8_9ACTN|nr:hypothetical protein [Micromonospora rosaria]KXK61088.1 hypothetical protein AWW66_15390 [Micromonospora rosaria]